MVELSEEAVRRTPDRRRAEAFALGLDAAAIDSRIERHDAEWWVLVEGVDVPAAQRALEGFDAEVDALAVVPLPTAVEPPSWLGAAVAVVLFGVYLATGPVEPGTRAFAAGAALSDSILHGEAYRTLTALTLHAHFAHVLANSVFAFVLLGALGRALGPGVAALLTLLTGALGNEATALWYVHGHSSVGASTAVFGALGLLTAPGTWRRESRWRAWVAAGASLALLGMLGTGAQSDVVAHVCGWALGGILGFAVALSGWGRAPGWVQALCGAATVAALGGTWGLALR